tara:strand:+ start:38814 stop:39017 length:204 start_codon:yes stop_codon:yes gene_type:complete
MIREVLERYISKKSMVRINNGSRTEKCYILRIWWDDMDDIVELITVNGLRWSLPLDQISQVEIDENF